MVRVCPEVKYKDKNGNEKEGFELDGYAEMVCQAAAGRVINREQDAAILIDGREGSGKSNVGTILAYRIASLTGRKFDHNNIFFNMEDMIKFAGSTKEQIIMWDEAVLGGMAADWSNFSQKKLISMLMVCRKKKHVFLFIIPRFYKLTTGIIERMHCMFHVFENKDQVPGYFMLIGEQSLEDLFLDWRRTRRAWYSKYKKGSIGHFPWIMPDLIDYDAYDDKKDAAILALANSTKEKKDDGLNKMKEREAYAAALEYIKDLGGKFKVLEQRSPIHIDTIREWRKMGRKVAEVNLTDKENGNDVEEEEE